MTQYELLPNDDSQFTADPSIQKKLGQYPTPVWFAEGLIKRHFNHLGENDFVVESSCGPGSFLMALPDNVPAMGVELDPRTAEIARINTNRLIVTGDFSTVPMLKQPTVIIGNPPFNLSVIDKFLMRAAEILPEEGQVGWILPTYAFQTADRVTRYMDVWGLEQEMIPRNIYPGLSLPLLFAKFTKSKRRTLIGFAMYQETADMLSLKKQYREIINGVGKSVWKATIAKALIALGGTASLEEICREIEGKKPTKTKWWREQIRKVLRQAKTLFKPLGEGRYALSSCATFF